MTRIRIDPDGTVRGLWTDSIDWQAIGRLAVRRASHVEFCRRRQRWYVRSGTARNALRVFLATVFRRPFGEILYWAKTRAEALAWERRYYEPGGPGWSANQTRRHGE